jgi:bacillolysin
MRPRQRAIVAAASLALAALTLTSATAPAPASHPGSPLGQPAFPDDDPTQVAIRASAQGTPTPPEPPAGALPRTQALRELRGGGADAPVLALNPQGTVGAVTASPGRNLGSTADGFVLRYAAALGMTKDHTMASTETTSFESVAAHRYQQMSAGLPVLGGQVVVMTGDNGAVLSAIAQTTPLKPAGSAKISPETARATGLAAAQAKYGITADQIVGTEAKLWLLDPTLIGLAGQAQLRPAYWVKLRGAETDDLASVLVDAVDGSVRLVASEHRDALNRIVCDLANTRVDLFKLANYACVENTALGQQPTTRVEGGPASSVADVNSAYNYFGIASNYYRNTFGRDSYDGHGGQIRATVRVCHSNPFVACPFNNAAYQGGGQFIFGQGWATDDVVAHEYTHAVTEHASDLFYWQQSGAINEALSDIFGEFIDLSNPDDGSDDVTKRWFVGENSPLGVLRNMANPPAKSNPDRLEQSGFWDTDPSFNDNGGVHTNSGVANKAAFLIADGATFNGQTVTGIGLAKSAQLWYRVMHMLPSGANYQQLGQTLGATCRTLIGHFGFTAADCQNSVDKAVAATWMLFVPSGMDPSQARVPVCSGDGGFFPGPAIPDNGEPAVDLFLDDMEKFSNRWVTNDDVHWQQIPNSDITYSYAAHGRGSVNGWTLPGQNGNGAWIEMAQPVVLPVGKQPFVHFGHSMDFGGAAGGLRRLEVQIQVNGGAWQSLTAASFGTMLSNGALTHPTLGYGTTKIDLVTFGGQSVKIRFQINDPANDYFDWYFDDFRLAYCDNLTGPPAEGYGFHTPDGISLNWAAPQFVSNALGGGKQTYQWEFSYSPDIAGAPATLPQGTTSVTIPGTDPNLLYKVTIRARTADGRLGAAREVLVTPGPPVVCPAFGPLPSMLSQLGRRPMPGLPAGACARPVTPRRG